MNTDAVFNAAHTTAIRMLESGAYIAPDSTVCALQTASGRIFTGVSHTEVNGHAPIPVHAEADAVRNMLAAGESCIITLLLLNTQSRLAMLPCNNCLGYIASIDPRNNDTMIVMPDRMIKLSEAGMYAAPLNNAPPVTEQQYRNIAAHAGNTFPPNGMTLNGMAPPMPPTSEVNTENSDSNMLKNKVNSLLGVADDDDEEEDNSTKTKKGLFGFFKK